MPVVRRTDGSRPLSTAVLGGVGYACLLLVAGYLAGVPFAPGPSLLGTGLPVLVPAALGIALCGWFAARATRFGLRSPVLVALVAVPVAAVVEAVSLRPSLASLFDIWAPLAPLVVGVAGVEYGLRRALSSESGDGSIRRSERTERAFLGGALAAGCLLIGFSLRGVGPLTALSAAGSIGPIPSASAVAGVLTAFGPPALLLWASVSLALRYGVFTPLVSLVAVGALLANPLGFAFRLLTAASPLLLCIVFALAAGEYVLRTRLLSSRPRSVVE